jgi:hypothetical protein
MLISVLFKLILLLLLISPSEILVISKNQEHTVSLKCIEENYEKHLNGNEIMQCCYISNFHSKYVVPRMTITL